MPWDELVGEPNAGHEAIADLLMTGAVNFTLSTNVDLLIERAAWSLGGQVGVCLDGNEAARVATTRRPVLKIHGCAHIDPGHTVWTPKQLTVEPVRTRIVRSAQWLSLNLREKHLLVVGFWSDWAYLNTVIEECVRDVEFAHITVIDIATSERLQEKAPALWALFNREGVVFEHVQIGGAEAVDELRRRFSRVYLRRVLRMAEDVYRERFGEDCPADWLEVPDAASAELYSFRRDAEGVPANRPAMKREPSGEIQSFAMFLLALRRAGGVREGSLYRFQDRLIRILNGVGKSVQDLQRLFGAEAGALSEATVVACVGAENYQAPGHLVRFGGEASVVRTGVRGQWLDGAAARTLIGL